MDVAEKENYLPNYYEGEAFSLGITEGVKLTYAAVRKFYGRVGRWLRALHEHSRRLKVAGQQARDTEAA